MTKPIGGPGQPSPKPPSQSFVSKVTEAIRDIATPIFEKLGNFFSKTPTPSQRDGTEMTPITPTSKAQQKKPPITSFVLDHALVNDGATIPNNVTHLTISQVDLTNLKIPEGVQSLDLTGCRIPPGFKIPESVKTLTLDRSLIPSGFQIPESVQHLSLEGALIEEGNDNVALKPSKWYEELDSRFKPPQGT